MSVGSHGAGSPNSPAPSSPPPPPPSPNSASYASPGAVMNPPKEKPPSANLASDPAAPALRGVPCALAELDPTGKWDRPPHVEAAAKDPSAALPAA